MLVALINQSCDRPASQVIQAAPNQREPLIRGVLDRRREIQLPIKPWLNGMLVRLWHVYRVVRFHKRSHVAGNNFLRDEVFCRSTFRALNKRKGRDSHKGHRSSGG